MKKKKLLNSTTKYVITTFFAELILFFFSRTYFLLRHSELADSVPLSQIFKAYVFGLKFDLMVIAYSLFILVPLLFFNNAIKKCFVKWFYIVYSSIIYLSIVLIAIIDAEYFGNFNSHLSIWAIEYLGNFDLIMYMVLDLYPWYILGLGALIAIVLSSVVAYFILKFASSNDREYPFYSRVIVFIVSGFLLFVAARGSVTLAPGDWGMAYFSNHHFANQLPLNGIYTFTKTLQEIAGDNDDLFFHHEPEDVVEIVREMVYTCNDSFINKSTIERTANIRRDTQKKFNIVIFLLESWDASFISCLNGPSGVTPNFDSLCSEGILFENMYATGKRSNYGISAVNMGFPAHPGRPMMKRYLSSKPYVSIAEALKPFGYTSLYAYGGDLGFDNMEGTLRSGGFEKIIGVNDFPKSDIAGKWGVPDGVLLEKMPSILDSLQEPFIASVFTLTSHEPFDLPEDFTTIYEGKNREEDFMNTINYADSCIGDFFRIIENRKWAENTIFVFAADHCHSSSSDRNIPHERYHIAGGMILPDEFDSISTIRNGEKYNKICSQIDILPTIFDILGIPVTHRSFGNSILDTTALDFALVNRGKKSGLIIDSLIYIEDLETQSRILGNINRESEINITEKDSVYHSKYFEYLEAFTQQTLQTFR